MSRQQQQQREMGWCFFGECGVLLGLCKGLLMLMKLMFQLDCFITAALAALDAFAA
jgi:hypothetical protein